jgi:hypothetical protein
MPGGTVRGFLNLLDNVFVDDDAPTRRRRARISDLGFIVFMLVTL